MSNIIQYRTPLRSYLSQVFIGLMAFICLSACSSDPKNRPSPLRTDSTMIGDISVRVEYSSPAVREREIFGLGDDFLVEYNKMWRTGANDASFITLSDWMFVDTTRFDSGSYAIFTIPSSDKWTIIFNKEWNQWGSYNYKDSLDVLRLKVDVKPLKSQQERMKFYFENDSLKFAWDNIGWAVRLSNLP